MVKIVLVINSVTRKVFICCENKTHLIRSPYLAKNSVMRKISRGSMKLKLYASSDADRFL